MKNIITIQHTQSIHHNNGMIGAWTDWELSDFGRQQADSIGKALASELDEHNYIMYTSDLKRAKQTAEIVGEHLGITPILCKELREVNAGVDTPTSREEYHKMITLRISDNYDPDYKPLPNAESDRELWQRINNFVKEIINSPNENIIVVSHGIALRFLFSAWISDDFNIMQTSAFGSIPGGVSKLSIDNYGRRVINVLNK